MPHRILATFVVLLFVGTSLAYTTNAVQNQAVSKDSTWKFQDKNRHNTGYSSQTLINSSNVSKLVLKWSTSIGGLTGSAVVVNGIVYVTGSSSIWAVNETTGKIVWVDGPKNGTKLTFTTRVGVTIDKGNLFAGTNTNLLVSLNAKTGALNWQVSIVKGIIGSLTNYAGIQATALVYKGKVIIGETSGDKGVRGFVRAFAERDGHLLWTFYTVPPAKITSTNQAFYKNSWGTNGSSGCTCGGGAVWNLPAVDGNTGIIYFGTGNPYPGGTEANVQARTPTYPSSKYTNLYTDSVLALNSTNGHLIWYFQMVPGDQRDYDTGMPVQLFTTIIKGVSTQVVGAGSKIGYYFVLNAKTGAFIYKTKLGIHLNDNATYGAFPGNQTYPGSTGGVDSFSTFNPSTNMIYTTGYNQPQSCGIGLTSCPISPRNATLYAIDASTGAIVWSRNMSGPGLGGGTSTTNDIVFTADGNHNFYALDARNGKILWARHDPSGGGVLWFWSWGAPSVTNGILFETTLGTSTSGELEAFSLS